MPLLFIPSHHPVGCTFSAPFARSGGSKRLRNSPKLTPVNHRIGWAFFFKIFFLMWIIFKVFIEFVTMLFQFYVLLFWRQGMWDLSSPTRDQTHILCIGR